MPLNGEYEPGGSEWVRRQVSLYEATDGREGGTLGSVPVVILSSIGARSGRVRKSPVIRVRDGERYAVVASAAGREKNPSWYANLAADPHVELQDGGEKRDYIAREVHGPEREEWWGRAVGVYSGYAEYAVGLSRTIPVFVLDPVKAN